MSSEGDTIIGASIQLLAETTTRIVRKYKQNRSIRNSDISNIRVAAEEALFRTRAAAISSVARIQIEEIATTIRYIDSLNLQGPALEFAMRQLEALAQQLSRDLGSLIEDMTGHAAVIPVQIYVENGATGPDVERSLLRLLAEVGIQQLDALEAQEGSWYRKLFGSVSHAANTPAGAAVIRAAEIQLVDRFQAGIDEATAGAVSTLISALEHTKGAVIQAGSVMVVKVNDKIIVRQLTYAQLEHWMSNPELFQDPVAALAELQKAITAEENYPELM